MVWVHFQWSIRACEGTFDCVRTLSVVYQGMWEHVWWCTYTVSDLSGHVKARLMVDVHFQWSIRACEGTFDGGCTLSVIYQGMWGHVWLCKYTFSDLSGHVRARSIVYVHFQWSIRACESTFDCVRTLSVIYQGMWEHVPWCKYTFSDLHVCWCNTLSMIYQGMWEHVWWCEYTLRDLSGHVKARYILYVHFQWSIRACESTFNCVRTLSVIYQGMWEHVWWCTYTFSDLSGHVRARSIVYVHFQWSIRACESTFDCVSTLSVIYQGMWGHVWLCKYTFSDLSGHVRARLIV